MFTREQVIAACDAIVAGFHPEHVGAKGDLIDAFGRTCFLGQLLKEMGRPAYQGLHRSEMDPNTYRLVWSGVTDNDTYRLPIATIARRVAADLRALPPWQTPVQQPEWVVVEYMEYMTPACAMPKVSTADLIAAWPLDTLVPAPDVTAAVAALIAESTPELQEA